MATLATFMNLILSLFVSSKAASNFDVPALFGFGDSTIDTGNNNNLSTFAKADFLPYGESLPGMKPTGRFCDGKLPIDFLVSALGLSDMLPPYSGHKITANDFGVCFASAGTGLDDETADTMNVQTIGQQLEEFKQYIKTMTALKGEVATQEFIKKSLFLISIGANDIIITYYLFDKKARYTLPQYHAFLLDRLKTFLQQLHELGARNFLVSGLPAVGCLPVQLTLESFKKSIIPGMAASPRSKTCLEDQNNGAARYNALLQQMIPELLREFNTKEKTRATYIDSYTLLVEMFNNPSKYGLIETRRGCCGSGTLEMGPLCHSASQLCSDPTKYLFFDCVHATQTAYKVVSEDIIKRTFAMLANYS